MNPVPGRRLTLPLAMLAGVVLLTAPSLAAEIQAESGTIADPKSPSSVIPMTLGAIDACAALDDEQEAALTSLLFDAALNGYITDGNGVALLEASGLPLLGEGEDPMVLLGAMALVVDAIVAGSIDPNGAIVALDVWLANGGTLEELAGRLDEQASPHGLLVAIGGALDGAGSLQTESSTVFAQVALLIEAGLPPGIAVRVVKQGIRDGEELDMETLLEELRLLGELVASGEPPGLAANAVTGRGQGHLRHQHQEHEEEQEDEEEANANNGPPGKAKENNGNANSNANGNGKKL